MKRRRNKIRSQRGQLNPFANSFNNVAGTSITGYLQNLSGQQQGANQTSGSQANTYGAGQQGLQDQLGGLYSRYLGGNVPTSFTEPQAAFNAFNTDFTNNTEPGLVAQYGAGSPQIGAQRADAQQRLAAGLYQNGISNYSNALGQGNAYAMTPTGQTSTGTGATQATNDQQVQGAQAGGIGSILSVLAQLFGL